MKNTMKPILRKVQKVLFLTTLVIFAISIANAEDGLQMLKQAEDTMGSISFSAKCDWQSGLTTVIIQKKKEPDENYNFNKEIIIKLQGITQTNVIISNKEGLWNILPVTKKAIRLDCLNINRDSAFCGILENGSNTPRDADYSYDFKQINGREMVVISQKSHIPTKSQIVETKFFVGRDDHILYGFTTESAAGEVDKMTVTEFKLLGEIDDDLFKLPEGFQEDVCTNIAQYSRQTIEEANALAQTPAFQKEFKIAEKGNEKSRYIIIGIMFVPTIIFTWFFLRGKFKSN